jgi:hypothetical protein
MYIFSAYKKELQPLLEQSLRKLIKYFDDFTLVGSPVFTFHINNRSGNITNRDVNDLDIKIDNKDLVPPEIDKDFMIYHYHYYPQNTIKQHGFYFALIDKNTKTKIDIFGQKPYFINDYEYIDFEGTTIKMPTLEEQFITNLLTQCVLLKGHKVWIESIDDLNLMFDYIDKNKATEILRKHHLNTFDGNVSEYMEKINAYLKEHPETLLLNKENKMGVLDCKDCIVDGPYEITPTKEAFDFLGINY